MPDGTESVDVKLPSGETITTIVPQGWSDEQIHANLLVKHPEFFRQSEASQVAARPGQVAPPLPNIGSMQQMDVFGNPAGMPLSPEQRARKGAYESANLKPIGETLGAIATGGLLPTPAGAGTAAKTAYLAGRAALSGAGVGAGAAAAGASPQETKVAAATGAISQPIAEGMSAAAQKIAPKIAETALRVSDRMRGRGRTIGDAVLEYTTGIKPSTLAGETKQAIGNLVGQMEQHVTDATAQGVTGSAAPAQQALNDAIQNLPRNARTVAAKFQGLNDLLDLGRGPQATYTPNELLEMKRGISLEMKSWPPEWQRMEPVKQLQSRLYGAIDGELDRIVPGNNELNQIISSLIPAKQQAARIAQGAPLAQRLAGRFAAHTGALTSSAVSGALGYKEGGVPGAIAGAGAGLLVPEAIASTSGQMAAARIINSMGDKMISPELLPVLKTIIATAAQKESRK